MLKVLIYFFVGISLSMDAFTLALSIGTTSPKKKSQLLLSILVGSFHFFMPIIGNKIGNIFQYKFISYSNYITAFILSILLIEMLFQKEEKKPIILNIVTSFIIALTVSLDSLTVGIAFGIDKEKNILAPIIFSILSSLFTYIGLLIGKKLERNYQKKAKIFGDILMFIVILKYLIFP